LKRNRKVLFISVFLAYCIFVLWMTLLKRHPGTERKIIMELFWSYRDWINGSKNGKREVIQNIKNVLFSIPFGMLFPWKQKGWKSVLFCAVLFSLLIEVIQYVFVLGWCELDDVICNSLGALLGYGIFSRIILRLVPYKSTKWPE